VLCCANVCTNCVVASRDLTPERISNVKVKAEARAGFTPNRALFSVQKICGAPMGRNFCKGATRGYGPSGSRHRLFITSMTLGQFRYVGALQKLFGPHVGVPFL